MKKLLLFLSLLIIAISLNTCDCDDDNPDKIIGKWQLNEQINDGIDILLSDCEKQTNVEFFENGTYTAIEFEDYETECIEQEPEQGLWTYLGNSIYKLSDFDINGIKITFKNNKMTVEYSIIENEYVIIVKMIFIEITS